jgi:type IV secretion system protein VirB2
VRGEFLRILLSNWGFIAGSTCVCISTKRTAVDDAIDRSGARIAVHCTHGSNCGVMQMKKTNPVIVRLKVLHTPFIFVVFCAPNLALAQASPFLTGANSLQTNILAWATPIAIILVMVLGVMAMANRISWGWPLAAIVGIAVVFGAPQMVTWIRGMFGV